MNPKVAAYLVYLAISLGLTLWVGRTLFRNGRVFLVDIFKGNTELADSVNHLLVVGFYLINFGYICLNLTALTAPSRARGERDRWSSKRSATKSVPGARSCSD